MGTDRSFYKFVTSNFFFLYCNFVAKVCNFVPMPVGPSGKVSLEQGLRFESCE